MTINPFGLEELPLLVIQLIELRICKDRLVLSLELRAGLLQALKMVHRLSVCAGVSLLSRRLLFGTDAALFVLALPRSSCRSLSDDPLRTFLSTSCFE